MFLPNLLNSNNLLQFFAGLEKKDKDFFFNELKSEILNRGTSALLHLIKIEQLNNECIREFSFFEKQLVLNDDRMVFSSMTLGFLINEVSPLLSTLRMLQNLLLKIVSNMESMSLPSSINDYVRKTKKYKISDKASKIIIDYWKNTGEKVKYYRDVDQHFNSLTERYFMILKPKYKIILEFPDNPEEKSAKKFTYSKKLDGLVFLQNAFYDLVETFDKLSAAYGAKKVLHQSSVSMKQLGELIPSKERTLSFMFEKNYTEKNEKVIMNLTGLGMNQLSNGTITMQKYLIGEDELKNAASFYQAKTDI